MRTGRILCCFLFLLNITLIGCAKRGSITGGRKDTIAPILKASFPKNFSTEFSGQTIKLSFDEFVKLKNINKQLVVSPPLSKNPQILPMTSSKTITITFLDSLKPDTTYSLNFGQSIEDNNEGNPYSQFKYVFSTGRHIDSLSIKGVVKDALQKNVSGSATVMLYEVNNKYNDSLVFKENPTYITSADEKEGTFQLNYLKAGTYKIIAVEDKNSNYRFEPKNEKIAFKSHPITVPNDSIIELKLFKEISNLQVYKPKQASDGSAIIGYEGEIKNSKFTLKNSGQDMPFFITKIPKQDSLLIWYQPIKFEKNKIDSLALTISKGDFSKKFTFLIKSQKHDSLSLSSTSKKILPLLEPFLIRSVTPITKIDRTKINLIQKDSKEISYNIEYDTLNSTIKFHFQKNPLERYTLKLLPEAVTDFMGQTNKKPLEYSMETGNLSDYGNLILNLENATKHHVIVELTDKTGDVKYTSYSTGNPQIEFNLIEPNIYSVRLIYDLNGNKKWDPGNFLRREQPEPVIYFPKDIDVRANWDVQQTFTLKE